MKKLFATMSENGNDSLAENVHIFNCETLDDDLISDESLYECYVQQVNIHLLSTVLALNNIKLGQFLGRGVNNLPVDVHADAFRNESVFFNSKTDNLRFACNSKDFRARFLSLMLIELAQKLEKCIDVMLSINADTEIDKLNLLSGFVNMILDFSINFLSVKDYDNSLELICELLLVAKKNKKKRNHDAITAYSEHMSFFRQPFTNTTIEPEALKSILKAAFIMVTGCTPDDGDFCIDTFNQYEREDVRMVIKLLGDAIINKVKNGKRVCHTYKIFNESKPYLFYKFKDINMDNSLNAGCRALSFLMLIANDNRLSKIIKNLCYV